MITVQNLRPQQELQTFAIAEAESLQIRTDLMLKLQGYIQQQGWTSEQAARILRQTLPRMQNLMNGEISRFSVEQLIQLLALVGLHVHVSIVD
ncbi:MAG: XRE family transcriptional regulator [Leptolyngbya sp. SIO1D8]|nr:XRE family transcriptional regulator [Leptolyngbya sp. SIO1D8]